MFETDDKIVRRAMRKFERGRNHFVARGILSDIAIELASADLREVEDRRAIANEAIVRMLAAQGAEGEVYATVQDTGSDGYVHSADAVRVTSRGGIPTGVERTGSPWGHVLRATTAPLEP